MKNFAHGIMTGDHGNGKIYGIAFSIEQAEEFLCAYQHLPLLCVAIPKCELVISVIAARVFFARVS